MLDALAAGHHVFVPKPPAMTLADTVQLSEAARKNDVFMMVNFESRFSYGVKMA